MPPAADPDPYRVLGVDPSASLGEIAHAYRILMRRHHPDPRTAPAAVPGPAVAGPAVAGPAVAGPAVAGPAVAGPGATDPAPGPSDPPPGPSDPEEHRHHVQSRDHDAALQQIMATYRMLSDPRL